MSTKSRPENEVYVFSCYRSLLLTWSRDSREMTVCLTGRLFCLAMASLSAAVDRHAKHVLTSRWSHLVGFALRPCQPKALAKTVSVMGPRSCDTLIHG